MKKKPIFIGGLMKSGTSLMRALIGNHSNVFGGLETWWFSPEFRSEFKQAQSKTARKLQNLYNVDAETYANLAKGPDHYMEFLDHFLLFNAVRESKTRWVEKTPDNIFHLDKLQDFWGKNFFFIYMMRNPLDTFASWKKNTTHPLSMFEQKILETVTVLSSDTILTSENIRLVAYEDLVSNTKEVMKSIISFLDEPWEDGIEINKKDKTEYNRVKHFAKKHSTTLVSLSKPIFTSSIDQYKGCLNQIEIDAIKQFSNEYTEILQASCLMPRLDKRS